MEELLFWRAGQQLVAADTLFEVPIDIGLGYKSHLALLGGSVNPHAAELGADMKNLLRLEGWIEQLVEEPFVRLFAGQLLPQDVATHLVRALEDGERIGADGVPEVPGCYRITLHPEALTALQAYHPNLEEALAALQAYHPNLEEALAAGLNTLVQRMDIRLHRPATVILHTDATLPPRSVRIAPATQPITIHEQTRDLDLSRVATRSRAPHHHGKSAYLIVQGRRTFDLQQETVRIGRALDNDLILEHSTISRHHAQVRYRYGRYILQDLGSSSGATVNGFAVQEVVLRAGDTLALGDVSLVYVEQPLETGTSSEKHQDTRPHPPTEEPYG